MHRYEKLLHRHEKLPRRLMIFVHRSAIFVGRIKRNPKPRQTRICFSGRKREMERLMDMLSGKRPQNVSIVGERRIGKSSLAFRVFHKIKGKDDSIL